MNAPELHVNLAAVAPLLGTWSGTGTGEYPTIEPFAYVETISFEHVGKPFLIYQQRTRRLLADGSLGEPLHAESGYWRFPDPHRVELIVSHPTGINEIEEGTLDASGALVIDLVSTSVALSSSAKEVTSLGRTFRLSEDKNTLEYTLRMGAVGLPLQHHLAATLARQPA